MFMAAALALRDTSPALNDPNAPLLPPLSDIRQVTRHIAQAVARAAQEDEVAEAIGPEELDRRLDENMWEPSY
jgi:malate dehydrogenase (oxaloacetate-decarboxylating)